MERLLVHGLLLRRTQRFLSSEVRDHCRYSLRLPTVGWSSLVNLGGWLDTKMVYPRTVTHLNTNRA